MDAARRRGVLPCVELSSVSCLKPPRHSTVPDPPPTCSPAATVHSCTDPPPCIAASPFSLLPACTDLPLCSVNPHPHLLQPTCQARFSRWSRACCRRTPPSGWGECGAGAGAGAGAGTGLGKAFAMYGCIAMYACMLRWPPLPAVRALATRPTLATFAVGFRAPWHRRTTHPLQAATDLPASALRSSLSQQVRPLWLGGRDGPRLLQADRLAQAGGAPGGRVGWALRWEAARGLRACM